MHKDRIAELASVVNGYVFNLLDCEPDCDSAAAGYVAHHVEFAFGQVLSRIMDGVGRVSLSACNVGHQDRQPVTIE